MMLLLGFLLCLEALEILSHRCRTHQWAVKTWLFFGPTGRRKVRKACREPTIYWVSGVPQRPQATLRLLMPPQHGGGLGARLLSRVKRAHVKMGFRMRRPLNFQVVEVGRVVRNHFFAKRDRTVSVSVSCSALTRLSSRPLHPSAARLGKRRKALKRCTLTLLRIAGSLQSGR
jgi:hypothetical protein